MLVLGEGKGSRMQNGACRIQDCFEIAPGERTRKKTTKYPHCSSSR